MLYDVDVVVGGEGEFHDGLIGVFVDGSKWKGGYSLIFFSLFFISYIISRRRSFPFTPSAGFTLSIIYCIFLLLRSL